MFVRDAINRIPRHNNIRFTRGETCQFGLFLPKPNGKIQ